MPWVGVTSRFSRFDNDLKCTSTQIADAQAKQLNVRKCLQGAYYGAETDDPPGFVVGSWSKNTQVRPSGDIDVIFPIPWSEWDRINGYSGNCQSALLQEVKSVLGARYSSTDLRGDGQVVQVNFNSILVEVVPAFVVDQYEFAMPNTHDGGSWKAIWPAFERVTVASADVEASGNVVRIARMMKHWKRQKSVAIKSFMIELLVVEFFKDYPFRNQSFFFFDWFVRDFFKHLIARAQGSIYAPGSGEFVPLGNAWLSKAQTALGVAEEACKFEHADYTTLAGLEWNKIFGGRIPTSV